MAQLVVRNLDDGVKARLRVRAAQHGRSMEAEVREILAMAVADDAPRDPATHGAGADHTEPRGGLGTAIAALFKDAYDVEGPPLEIKEIYWGTERPYPFPDFAGEATESEDDVVVSRP